MGSSSMAAAMSLQQGRAFFGSTRPFATAPKKAVTAHAAPVQAAIVASAAAGLGVAWQRAGVVTCRTDSLLQLQCARLDAPRGRRAGWAG